MASELGFDPEDLESLDEDLKQSKCSGIQCLMNPQKLKWMNKIQNGEFLADKSKEAFDKIKCHPFIQKEVAPRVQFLFILFPFNYLCLECNTWINCFLLYCNPLAPCCWIIYCLILPIVLPWNLFWEFFLMLPLTTFCCPCMFLLFFSYYLVMPP